MKTTAGGQRLVPLHDQVRGPSELLARHERRHFAHEVLHRAGGGRLHGDRTGAGGVDAHLDHVRRSHRQQQRRRVDGDDQPRRGRDGHLHLRQPRPRERGDREGDRRAATARSTSPAPPRFSITTASGFGQGRDDLRVGAGRQHGLVSPRPCRRAGCSPAQPAGMPLTNAAVGTRHPQRPDRHVRGRPAGDLHVRTTGAWRSSRSSRCPRRRRRRRSPTRRRARGSRTSRSSTTGAARNTPRLRGPRARAGLHA